MREKLESKRAELENRWNKLHQQQGQLESDLQQIINEKVKLEGAHREVGALIDSMESSDAQEKETCQEEDAAEGQDAHEEETEGDAP